MQKTFQSGTIILKPISAELAHDVEWLGKQDPFIIFTYGTQRERTKTAHDAGKHPKFTDQVSFRLT